jgi:cytochrome c
MVKKAVAAINSDSTEKAYAEIDDPKGPFVDRDLYIVVYRMDGLLLAHGADKTRIGVNLLHDKDVDCKEFVKERVELAKTAPSFWQTVEPKQMYCVNDTVLCGGVYQS